MKGFPAKIAIIVPIYNAEKYLSACLESCIKQTLRDIEIICVNDGSTDESQKIVDAFAKKDHRVVSIEKENGGLSSARNVGIEAANAEFVMFLDSDDFISENACERVWLEALEAYTDIITFNTKIFPDKPTANAWMYETLTKVQTKRYWGFEPAVLFSEPGAKPFVWRQAYRKEFLDANNLRFDETIKFGEDTVFQMEAFPHGESFAFIEDVLYHYRWYREGSMMAVANADPDSKIDKHLLMLERITEYWNKQNWLEVCGDWYLNWLLDFSMPDIQRLPGKNAEKHLIRLNRLLDKYNLEDCWQSAPSPTRKAYVNVIHRVGEKNSETMKQGKEPGQKNNQTQTIQNDSVKKKEMAANQPSKK